MPLRLHNATSFAIKSSFTVLISNQKPNLLPGHTDRLAYDTRGSAPHMLTADRIDRPAGL